MVAPVWQTCPECGDQFEGSDCLGRPCPNCDGTADPELQMELAMLADSSARRDNGADGGADGDGETAPEGMSVAGHVWRKAMNKPFVVRATVGRVHNEIAGRHATLDAAIEQARELADGAVVHAISGRTVWPEADAPQK